MKRYNPLKVERIDPLFLDSACALCGEKRARWRIKDLKADLCGLCLLNRTTFGEWVSLGDCIQGLKREHGVSHILTDEEGRVVNPLEASMIVAYSLKTQFRKALEEAGENRRD